MDHRFVRFGITELFPDQPLDGRGIIAERVNVGAQLAGDGVLFLQLGVEPENFPAHPFVLMDERQVGHDNQNQNGHHHQRDDRLGEFAPDAKINFHAASLTARGAEVKADFTDNSRAEV